MWRLMLVRGPFSRPFEWSASLFLLQSIAQSSGLRPCCWLRRDFVFIHGVRASDPCSARIICDVVGQFYCACLAKALRWNCRRLSDGSEPSEEHQAATPAGMRAAAILRLPHVAPFSFFSLARRPSYPLENYQSVLH